MATSLSFFSLFSLTNMPTCKAPNCKHKLNKEYVCVNCAGTYHKKCGKFLKLHDEIKNIKLLCSTCLELPDILKDFPNLTAIRPRTNSLTSNASSSKKRKISEESECSSDTDSTISNEDRENITLSDIAKLIRRQGRKHESSMTKLTDSVNEMKEDQKHSNNFN